MIMKEYTTISRLLSDQFVGKQHVSVQRHSTKHYPQHWHNYFEIELVLSGYATHIYNGCEYSIEKGDLYLLTPVDFHGMDAKETVELINISFDDAYLPPSMLSWLSAPDIRKLYRLTIEEFERFYMATQLLEYECSCGGNCTMQLLEYLLSCFTRLNPESPEQNVEITHLQGIKKAISYIEMHFREPVTLGQLAALSGYNQSYFSELFRKVTGQTYKERLRELRISYAKMLLANGLPVSETCFASGFGSLSNFTAAFREKCGMSPKDYRKIMYASGKNTAS